MKKNVLLRTLAGMSAIAILGVSTLVGASAASEDKKITMSIDKVTGKAGETVTVAVSVKNNPGFEGFGAVIDFNGALTAEESYASGSLLTKKDSLMVDLYDDYLIFSGGTSSISTASEGTLITFDFTIPEDAEVGTVYDITWNKLDDFSNTSNVYTDEVELVDGSITVVKDVDGGGTIPPAPPAPPVTTPATEDEAPKTGASTKGIAATSAVLLAAACSAVALKKKRD